jgi:glycine cleavage system protein P-like pyridoxal-binding family
VKKLDDLAAQQTDIMQKITTNETGNWTAKLLKPHFAFSDVNGEINTLEFNCANKQSTLNYKPGSVMEVPEAWGSCTMKVNAKPNTVFNIIQLQQKPA